VQLLLLCPPSHLLDHRSQTNPREEAPPIKHRHNHLLNRQCPKYPSVHTVHSRRERCHDAELDEPSSGGICPVRRKSARRTQPHTHAPLTALARAIRTTRRGSEMLLWHGGPAAPCRTRRMKPVVIVPTSTRLAWSRCVRYVRFCDWRRMRDE
jgi:hypothetical protein